MRTIIRNNYEPQMGDYHEKILIDEERHKKWIFDCDGVFSDFTNPLVVSERGESQDFAASQEWVTREVETLESGKQDRLTAGNNITIEDNVISAIAATYVAGDNIQINGDVISATDTIYDDTEVKSDITNLQNAVQGIEEKIPSAASSANQLADKNFVNSSIATNTTNFIGTFNSVAELEAYSGPLTNNDYAFVVVTDAVGNTAYDRYKYNGNTSEWLFEYELNNSSFTADQWAAINSGITSSDVTKLGNLADIQTIGANLTLANGELSATDTTYTAGTNVQISDQNIISATDTTYTAGTGLALNGTEFSVDTTVIAEKTDIPTVNNATLTITQNGTSAGTFTANSATDATIALTDTTYSNYTGATSLADGTAGLVPAPLAGDETKFLSGNGQWTTVSQYSLPIASANDLGGIKVGNNLTINSTTGVLDATDTTYSNFVGTDGQTAGVAGLVPAPATTDAGKFLKADGTWGDAGSPINVVQTTGTSTTDVMSQNAVTSMVFADPASKRRIQIGDGAAATTYDNTIAIGREAQSSSGRSIAIGYGSKATGIDSISIGRMWASGDGVIAIGGRINASESISYRGSVALGYDASPTAAGQVMIGTGQNAKNYSYNNSGYRLLSGVYDPQSDHDAATKGYVDTSITTAISGITGVEFEVVQTLPATGDAGTIYLVPNQGTTPNIYDEYIYVNNAFEKIGTTEIDLSNYVTTTDLSTALADYTTTANLATVATTGDYNDLTNTPAVFTTAEWNALWA